MFSMESWKWIIWTLGNYVGKGASTSVWEKLNYVSDTHMWLYSYKNKHNGSAAFKVSQNSFKGSKRTRKCSFQIWLTNCVGAQPGSGILVLITDYRFCSY
jgi:hypothetical protein